MLPSSSLNSTVFFLSHLRIYSYSLCLRLQHFNSTRPLTTQQRADVWKSQDSNNKFYRRGDFFLLFFFHSARNHMPTLRRIAALLTPGGLMAFSCCNLVARSTVAPSPCRRRDDIPRRGIFWVLTRAPLYRATADYWISDRVEMTWPDHLFRGRKRKRINSRSGHV
jgi:hypothetical protein